MNDEHWYAKSASETIAALHSNEQGLAPLEAARRLTEQGRNELPKEKGKGLFSIFINQFKSPLIYLLLGADALVFYLKEFTDAFIILFILLFNAILGTVQEGRAQNTLAKLASFVKTRAEVLRGGTELNIPDEEVVPGDIILVQEGEKVPADARLTEARSLKVDEAALTGESEPVHKTVDPVPGASLPTAEQRNMLFKGTAIAVGAGKAIVVATGTETVIGRISKAIAGINTEIPLTKNLRELARVVVLIVGLLIVAIFVTGVAEGKDIREMFVAAVAIAVAAVPEGLPLVLTITLAAGVWRMAKKRVLVKKLQAVEALGQAQEIAVDKTGTITKNELVVQKVIAGGREFVIEGVGYNPLPLIENPHPDLLAAGRAIALCSNAHIAKDAESSHHRLVGDPTEGALTVLAGKLGVTKEALTGKFPVQDWPFDYQKKFHLVTFETSGGFNLAITGAPEAILALSDTRRENSETLPMDQETRKSIEERFFALSGEGLRVIAFATASGIPNGTDPDHLPSLTFGGLIAMRDALRPGIKENVLRAHDAGIRVFMITGDHAITAKAIARDAGIYREGDEVITGDELDALPEEELNRRIGNTTVFARVTPEHKMKIIQNYRKRGEVIAMTGDGVNDAPSLVAADLGIAMGKIGTEVAKEASDLILLDDNFGDILSAVEEGRNMRQGIRRTISYLFSSNIGEILLIALALAFRDPLPLLAAQLIWMNVVTDTFFDISLALEPKDVSLMRKGARIPKRLFDRLIATRLAFIAPVIAGISFVLFQGSLADPTKARTIALTSLIIFQWFNSLNCRSEQKSIFTMNPFSNRFLLTTLVGVAALHSFALYNPFMNSILKIVPLSVPEIAKIAALGLTVVAIEELRKFFYRRTLARTAAA